MTTEDTTEETPVDQVADGNQPDQPEAAQPEEDFRSKFAAQRKVNRDLETQLKSARDLVTKLQGEKPTITDPDVAAIRAEAEQAAAAKAAERIMRAELKASSVGKLADPTDAMKFLDLSQFSVDNDGNVDAEEIGWAIDDLVKRKPYLAAQSGKRFNGSADGGVRKGSRPDQLTREQIQSMSSDAVEAARQKGQLNDLLGIK